MTAFVRGSNQHAATEFVIAATNSVLQTGIAPVLPTSVSAPQLADCARAHRVPGLVHRFATTQAPHLAQLLAADAQAGLVRHMQASALLHQVGSAFDAADVTWLVMKGPVVAQWAYPQATTRWYGDVDLLVSATQLPQAVALLEELGCRLVDQNFALIARCALGELHFQSPGGVGIDLHFELVNHGDRRSWFGLTATDFLAHRQSGSVSGHQIWGPGDAAGLVHLLVHAALSGGDRLGWLVDSYLWLRRRNPDIAQVAHLTDRWRCRFVVGLMAHRVHQIWPVPQAAMLWQNVGSIAQRAALRAVNQVPAVLRRPGAGGVGKSVTTHAQDNFYGGLAQAAQTFWQHRRSERFVESSTNPESVLFDSSATFNRADFFTLLAKHRG